MQIMKPTLTNKVCLKFMDLFQLVHKDALLNTTRETFIRMFLLPMKHEKQHRPALFLLE